MPGRLAGKVAIVTGGARGLGAAVCLGFVAEGAAVLVGDVLEAEGAALAAELGERGDFVRLDVADEDDWARALARCRERFGTPTVLVSNAGIVGMAAIHEESLEGWRRLLDVDLTGVFLGMRAVVPGMREVGGGSIVNVSSSWGLVAGEGGAAYHAAKGGVTLLSKNGAVTYARDGIRVNSLHPGGMDTAMIADAGTAEYVRSRTPLGRIGRPEEVASAVVWLASDEASFTTGAAIAVDGGYTAI